MFKRIVSALLGCTAMCASALAALAPTGNYTPVGQTGSWTLIFDDEFTGKTLDTTKWWPSWSGATAIAWSWPMNTLEKACYEPTNITEGGGWLTMQLRTNTSTSCQIIGGAKATYSGAFITTEKSFTFTYGYVESRMYLPGTTTGLYNWPVIWTLGLGTWPYTGEFDIAEATSPQQNNTKAEPCVSYHYTSPDTPVRFCPTGNYMGWHVYGMDREPGVVNFYYDGKLIGSLTQNLIVDAQAIIIDYSAGGWGGAIKPNAPMYVDYVRVWQKQ